MLRRLSILSLLAALIALLSACATLNPGPRTFNVSQEQLIALITKQFPFNNRMLEVLDVNVSAPKISFDAVNNRINTSLDLNVLGSGLVGALLKRDYKGGIDLSYGLRFEPSDNSIRMTDVRVNRLAVDGLSSAMQRPVDRLGVSLAEQLLKDFTLYKLKPEDLQAAKGWGYKPGKFNITNAGLAITLDPVAK